jgi:ribonuclease III
MKAELPIEDLQEAIGYVFQDTALLERALTRRAYAHEAGLPDEMHQEALATLGDAVVSVAAIHAIMQRGIARKGEITAEKMRMVSLLPLNAVGRSLELQKYIRFNRGEEKQEIWRCSDALTETLEAVIGAAYLDGGMEAAIRVLRSIGGFG